MQKDDVIYRQDAIDEVVAWLKDRMTDKKNGKPLTDRIKDLPSAQSERKMGTWVAIKNRNGTTFALRCSLCGNSPKRGISSDFCPNCGADMRGKQDD